MFVFFATAQMLCAFLFLNSFVVANALPSCDEILRTSEDGERIACHYCSSERLQSECNELCKAKGCLEDDEKTTAASTNPVKHTKSQKLKVTPAVSAIEGNSSDSCNNLEPCVDIESANERFQQCCKDKNFAETCWKHCRYNVTKQEVQYAFTHHECEINQTRKYLYCAASNQDHNYCCTEKHVTDGPRNVCEPFCNPGSKDWPKKAELKYVKCLSKFEDIMKCHWAALKP